MGTSPLPRRLVELFDAAVESYRLFVLNAQRGLPVRQGVIPESPFVGPGMRDVPTLDYLPMRLSLVPRLFEVARPPDVLLLHTSSEHQGKVSLGTEVNIMPAAIEQARARGGIVVAQVNPLMPYTYGDGELDVDAVDLGVHVEEELPSVARHTVSDVTAAIGTEVATLIEDGATIQVGIGEIPDAVLAALTRLRGLGVSSEAISDGVLALEHGGALDASRPVVTTFLFGTPELYSWVDRNPRVRVLRTETVNDPSNIAAHPMMFSLNTALQVDLLRPGQRQLRAGSHLLRIRWTARFRGGGPAFRRRPRRGGVALVARQDRHLDDRLPAGGAGDIVPALGGGLGTGAGAALRPQPAGAGASVDQRGRPPRRQGGIVGVARLSSRPRGPATGRCRPSCAAAAATASSCADARHAAQDVVEDDDGGVDVGPFVQHDALRPLAHRRIGDLGPGRLARPASWSSTSVAQITGR